MFVVALHKKIKKCISLSQAFIILLLYKIVTIFCLYNPSWPIPYLGAIGDSRFSLQESPTVAC